MAMKQSEAVGNFVARIKQTYSKRRLNREKQWPPCESEKLVRLELVEGERRQGYSSGQTRGRDDKAIKRRTLAYSDILKAKDSTGTLKVLVEGDAGIGKTILCTALSEDWANEKLFQEFEILLLLHLRQKRIASAGSLLDLLGVMHCSPEVCKLVAKHIENQNEGKILIIADGWDELSTKDRSEGSFLYEFLFGECYSLSVIVTSRPYASAPLRDLPCIDRLVEVHGFSKVNIKEFIQCEFASDRAKCSGLLEQLEGNPLIESVCSVPLNCAIVCHLWHQFEGALPTTMSELYTKIILNVTLRNIQKRPEYERIHSLSHFSALPDSLQQPWSLLCELAFQTLTKDKIVFSHEDLSRKFRNLTLDSELLCFGLLQSAESILVDGHGVSFHFLHLTFQEYLAALYLVRQPPDKQLQQCRSCVASLRFRMVWMFFFGISFAICKQAINPDVSKVLLDAYSGRFINSNYLILSLCHFALEANQRSVDDLVVSILKSPYNGYVMIDVHTAFDVPAAMHVLGKLQACRYVTINLSNCGLDDKQVTALAEVLAGEYRKLKVADINLSGNKLSDQSVAHLFDRASPAFSRSLWHIILCNNMIGPKAIKSITTVLAESLVVATDYERNYYDYTNLSLDDNPLGTDGVRALRDALCANKLVNLESLSLARSLTDNQDNNAELILALGSGHCRSLRELTLSGNILGEPGGKALGKILPNLHSEVSLYLGETMLGDEGISAFSQNLQGTCKLESLYLENNDIRLAGISCLAESIYAGKILLSNNIMSNLKLTNNPLGLEGVIAVVKILSVCSDHFLRTDEVLSIDLSGCQLTTAGGIATNPDFDNAVSLWQFICNQQLKAACFNEKLVVDNINFSGEGIHVLASFMYACPCVDTLHCSSCGITSDDLKQLLDQISELRLKFSLLYCWVLHDNDIGDDGVSALIQHLSMFPKLRCISLYGNIRVSPGMLKTLEEKLDAQRESSDLAHPTVGSSNESDNERTESDDEDSPHSDTDSTGSDSCADSSSASEVTESEDYGENTLSHMEDSDTEEQCRAKEAEITAVTLTDVGNRPKLNVEVSPPSKRVMPTEDEEVEQMQPTSEETTITEAESELGNKQEVVHASTSSSFVVGSSSGNELVDIEDCREKASPHMADSDTVEQYISGEVGITTVAPKDVGKRRKLIYFEVPPPSKRMRTVEDEGMEQLQPTALDSEERTMTEAESELGNQQEVVHLSTNSSPVVGSSSDCHTELMDSEDCIEKASPHMADSDMEVRILIDFNPQSFEGPFTSATSSWKLQNVHEYLTGEGVVIAILDTGIDKDHEAFKKKFEQRAIIEFNFVGDNVAAFSKPEPHGTMAAFVAAGKGFTAMHKQGGKKIIPCPIPSGVAPNAKLIICRVGTPYKVEYIIKALECLIEMKKIQQKKPRGEQNSSDWGVDVVSMSFGVTNDTLTSTREIMIKMQGLIEELSNLKVIVVAAAGNYGDNEKILFPANHQNVFSVGVLSKYNRPAAMTPSGDVNVYAPGIGIAAPLVHIPDGVETAHGTSCATPAIAGLVALKIQFERDKCKLLKDVSNYRVQEILTGESVDFYNMNKVFKDMRTDVDRPNVLDPYNYFKIKCRLNIK